MEIRLVSCVGREWDLKLGYSRQLPLVQSSGSEKKELFMDALQWMLSFTLDIFKIAHYKIIFSQQMFLFFYFWKQKSNMCDTCFHFASVFALYLSSCNSTYTAWIWTFWIQEITWQWVIIPKVQTLTNFFRKLHTLLYILYIFLQQLAANDFVVEEKALILFVLLSLKLYLPQLYDVLS